MPEARELSSVIEAAEQAASAGDYVAAELHLREAAALQEVQLGPFHADLANTLNNLGVVYERADSPAEAELCYRRAYAIATRVLASNWITRGLTFRMSRAPQRDNRTGRWVRSIRPGAYLSFLPIDTRAI